VVAFAAVDKSFPARNNDNLVDVMISGCLAQLLDAGGLRGTIAALALGTMTLSPNARTVVPIELLDAARAFLKSEGGRVRESAHRAPGMMPPIRALAVTKASAIAVEEVAANQWDGIAKNDKALAAAIDVTAKATDERLSKLREDVTAAFTSLGPRLRDPAVTALQEETQILWWLFGAWSDDAGQPFSHVLLPGAGLIIGKEFADLLRFATDHPRGSALIARAIAACGGAAEASTLVDTVLNTPVAWRKETGTLSNKAEALTPILCAVARSAEAPGSSWQEAFTAVTGVSATLQLTPSLWASHICQELLLQRALSNAPA
jgi:hypothetical protein